MLPDKEFFLPHEIAERFRFSTSYVYWLIRHDQLQARPDPEAAAHPAWRGLPGVLPGYRRLPGLQPQNRS
jgi:hypothetical protein